MILFLSHVQIRNTSFIADNIQKKCNKKHVSLGDITLEKKVMFYSDI